jgi:F-type H+-transporting ATPase subunit epsilon
MSFHVELVAVEREVWSGEADQVSARTVAGEIGILAGHTPLLGQLAEGYDVRIEQAGGSELVVTVAGGFISVTPDVVTILAESVTLPGETASA